MVSAGGSCSAALGSVGGKKWAPSRGASCFLVSPALSSPPIAVFLARERLAGKNHSNASSLEFDVVSLSDSMGWEVPLVKRALRQLQWDPRLRQGIGIPGFLTGGGEKKSLLHCRQLAGSRWVPDLGGHRFNQFLVPSDGRSEGKSGVMVEFGELSFHLRAYGDLTNQELDSVCDFLHRRVVAREKMALGQLRACFQAFQR